MFQSPPAALLQEASLLGGLASILEYAPRAGGKDAFSESPRRQPHNERNGRWFAQVVSGVFARSASA